MGLEADAVAIAAGEMRVMTTPGVLDIARRRPRRPVPLAFHRSGEWSTVFFVIAQSDGNWRTEIVPVVNGEVMGYGGGAGWTLPERSGVSPGTPLALGEFRQTAAPGLSHVAVEGVSADDTVTMRVGGVVVAEATVAPHGYFLLTAVLPEDAEVTVEASPRTNTDQPRAR